MREAREAMIAASAEAVKLRAEQVTMAVELKNAQEDADSACELTMRLRASLAKAEARANAAEAETAAVKAEAESARNQLGVSMTDAAALEAALEEGGWQ